MHTGTFRAPGSGFFIDRPVDISSARVGKASWAGGKIIADQVSQFGVKLYDLLVAVFANDDKKSLGDLVALKSKSGISDEQWTLVIEYAAQVLSNLGNYR